MHGNPPPGLPPPRARRLLWFGPLARRLFLTILAGLLPLALLSFATLLHNAHEQKRQLIQATDDTMRAVITALDAELKQALASLDALAVSPQLAIGDLDGLRGEARELLERRPGWVNIILSDPSARQLMNAQLPAGTSLPAHLDPDSVLKSVQTRQPSVGSIHFSDMFHMYTVAVRLPVLRGGEVKYVLSAVLSPDAFRELLIQQRIPEHGVVGVFDSNFNMVARSRNHSDWVGRPVSPTFMKVLKGGHHQGWALTKTLEGMDVYSVFHRSDFSSWSVGIGLPVEAFDGPVIRSYIVLGSSILLSVLLGFYAAFLIARKISRPMRELESAAVAVGKGEAPLVPDTELPEIKQAALALAAAHEEREQLLQSEREAAYREQEARLLAENANKMKDEFLAMLGHELRNPLAAISTASQILEQADRAPKEVGDQAKSIIKRQVRHLARLTDDLLDAGRVMMGKITLHRRPVDLAAVVQGAVDTLKNTGRLSGHELKLSLSTVWVEADATRIDQIAANLLTNAEKYTPPPGTIFISVAREGGEAVLRVRDSGLGLEHDLLPRVFDLFVQGRRSLDRSQGGLGIGLTLVRRLTELHEGRVEAKSDGPGSGSEFSVYLPAVDALVASPADEQSPMAAERRTIAIVEDNVDLRTSLKNLLTLQGHRVHEANDGLSGIDTILRERVDVALVDVGLPLLDGYGVARAVRARATHPVRLIAMTGYGSPEDVARGSIAGFDAYLVKPVDPMLLAKTIAEK